MPAGQKECQPKSLRGFRLSFSEARTHAQAQGLHQSSSLSSMGCGANVECPRATLEQGESENPGASGACLWLPSEGDAATYRHWDRVGADCLQDRIVKTGVQHESFVTVAGENRLSGGGSRENRLLKYPQGREQGKNRTSFVNNRVYDAFLAKRLGNLFIFRGSLHK